MKQYIMGLFYLLLLASCEKDSPIEPEIPDNNGGNNNVGLPTLITNPNTDLTRYSTKLAGALTDAGDSEVIEAGFVIDTTLSPTIQKNLNKLVREPDQNGLMIAIILDIPASTTYYIRSYATNQQGTGYGNEIQFSSLSENVFKGNATLTTQSEVEEFGKGKYTRIDGSLEIMGSVTDLSPLNNLAAINYAFNVRYTSELTTIKGMDSLEAVNAAYLFHGMRIEHNAALKSLEGLEKLIGNNGYLYIINNDELINLNGLNNLSYNHFGELRIEGCDQLRSLQGLDKLNWLDGDIMIKDNPVLEDVTSFGSLNVISGRIRIMNNASLQSVDGFESLHQVDGIELYDNLKLLELKGFSNLDAVTTSILLKNNNALKDLSGLEKITTCEFLTIENSPSLTTLKGLENLQEIKYSITISNTGLTSMDELGNLKRTQRLDILSNETLENISGLNNLAALAQNPYGLTIASNDQLKSLSGLDNLKRVDGRIIITDNQMLHDFCSLKPLLKTGWNNELSIAGNASNPNAEDIKSKCP